MALIKQISSIVNDAFNQAVNPNAVSQLDTSTVVSMGKTIEKYDLYESFYKQLTNRIVKTVYFMRTYSPRRRSVLRDEHEFGAFVQKVYYKMPEAVDDPAYSVTEDAVSYSQQSPYDIETVIEVDAEIFGGQGVWSYEIIRPLVQIKTAFTSDAAMLAFISGIYTAVDNRMNKDIETLENMAVSTAIADTYQKGVARNLLQEYNDLTSAALTVKQALTSPEFLRFASMEINKVIGFMGELSTVFNVKKYETFTSRENLVVEVLTHFAEASKFYLQSDVYHNTLTELPRYEEIPFWQSIDKYQTFDVCSGIHIKNDGLISESLPSNPTGVVEMGGIIAYLHDIENVACYFGERRTWEMVNPRSDVMIHGEKARKGYAVDGHANSVVFYIK